jgi:EAL domain-containing protein (putative c-di-GMP-specific phosphodiesterase class I)
VPDASVRLLASACRRSVNLESGQIIGFEALIRWSHPERGIDRSFVHDLLPRNGSRAIIQAVVQLASSLGMKTTAEGVETQGESDYLKRAGCTEAQGILFGKAGPPKYAQTLLRPAGQRERSSMA